MTPAALRSILAGLPAAVGVEVTSALQAVAETVVAEARRHLDSAYATPSAAGEPPADPTGALAASLTVVDTPEGFAATAASPHAFFLEYGTTRMAARPFLRPAADAAGDEARQILAAALARAVAVRTEAQS